ncbi:MAG: hypothetical protein ACI9BD_000096 [Candidatus Marinamargulisbacteria bacterium]|jgi:hypothetical protein
MNSQKINRHLSGPENYHLSSLELFFSTVKDSSFAEHLEPVLALLENGSTSKKIIDTLEQIKPEKFTAFIHLLHITMFVKKTDKNGPFPQTLTPVTDSIETLLSSTTLETALKQLTVTLTDVLTVHPVDMDRGLILSYKDDYESLHRAWKEKKEVYKAIENPNSRMVIRADLNTIHQNLKNIISQLLHTPNYRQNRIQPESEQRQLSRSIKDYETIIVSHWDKLITVVQTICLQHLLGQLITEDASLSQPYKPHLSLPHSTESLETLKAVPALFQHTLYPLIRRLPETLKYQLETWRADMDGNPFITEITMGLSTAYGRKRSFERLSADEAVIRYRHPSQEFKKIEATLGKRLTELTETGAPAWQDYIKDREKSGWNPVQIYSGLAYYRMVELTEAAESFSRNPGDFSLLKAGFESHHDFLTFTAPLEDIEASVGIKGGVWAHHRRLVELRELALGRPHIRKGEQDNYKLLKEIKNSKKTLSKDAKSLLHKYQEMMKMDNASTLIQSDSGDITKSIKASIELLREISTLIKHKGKIVILCENQDSMQSAISLMTKEKADFFNGIIMMCAGSDNQKKLGPFYAAYLNHLFLRTAYEKGIDSFFGVGDSPLRSSFHTPISSMKTFQPGSRKHHFFGDRIHQYLSTLLATHITEVATHNQRAALSNDLNMKLFKLFGECMYDAYKKVIRQETELHSQIKSISEIVTTYFSRPSKKAVSKGFILDQIRAIDSGRAQIILNTFDPQLAGFNDGIVHFFEALKKDGISISKCQHFFTTTSEGTAMLKTLAFFAETLDDNLVPMPDIRTVTQRHIKEAYLKLSGRSLSINPDSDLRLVRQIWAHVSKHPNLSHYNAQTLMLFGANWMV